MTIEQQRLISAFGLTGDQRAEVAKAFEQHPAGTELCAHRAQAEGLKNRNTGAGLFLTMIRRGDHILPPPSSKPERRITGWRFQRGSHSGSYVTDPAGTDPPPQW